MSPKILIVDDEPDILYLLEIMIESEFEVEIIKANDGKEALDLLNNHHEVTLILSDYNMPKATGGDLYQHNITGNNVPFILLTAGDGPNELSEFQDFYEDNPLNTYLSKPTENEQIIEAIANILNKCSDQGDFGQNLSDYKRVKVLHLERFAHKDYDLFLEIGKGKIIQIASQKNADMKQVLEHYKAKEVEYIFLLKDDYETFVEHTKELIQNHTNEINDLTERQEITFAALDLAFSVAQEELDTLKISKVHQQLVDRSVEETLQSLKENKDLFSLLKNFLVSQDYITNHTILNIYFSSFLLSKLNWSNDQTLKQLIYACFYHDFEIKDQELAKIENLDEVQDPERKKLVKEHPAKAAKLVEGLKGLNNEAHKIIMDHHEKPDGSGFPQGLEASNTPPMSCVFIISHDIVDYLIKKNFQTQYLATKIQSMEQMYNRGNYKRPFICAREILLD